MSQFGIIHRSNSAFYENETCFPSKYQGSSEICSVTFEVLASASAGVVGFAVRGFAARKGRFSECLPSSGFGLEVTSERLVDGAGRTISETKLQKPMKCQKTMPLAKPSSPQIIDGLTCGRCQAARGRRRLPGVGPCSARAARACG